MSQLRYFEVEEKKQLIFGEAIAFYFLPDYDCNLVVVTLQWGRLAQLVQVWVCCF